MPRKKKEEIEETKASGEAAETEGAEVLAAADDAAPIVEESAEPAEADGGRDEGTALAADATVEKKTRKPPAKAVDETVEADEPSIIDAALDAAAGVVETVAVAVGKGAADIVSAISGSPDTAKVSKRAEKIGIVASDKMTKTVTVRVDRVVKHPVYRKYVKKRKKFMAHDEMGAKIGDKVKIVETRPMSARKRWRVVEIIQKAEL